MLLLLGTIAWVSQNKVVFIYTDNVFIIFNLFFNMNNSIFIVGLIILIAGFLTYFYEPLNVFRAYALTLIVVGFLVLIAGALMPSVRTVTTHKETVMPEKRTKVVVAED